ncbi:MAG: S-layer homology domain-containing protein [Candidatus Ornithomonoglobus sp.]
MKQIKRITAMAGAVLLSFGINAMAFSDMPPGEMGAALENAVKNGIMDGYDDNTIKPDDHITRAEMAAMITRCFGAEAEEDISGFTDVSEEAWYYSAMSRAVAMGAFEGDGDRLSPEDNITFQEVYAVMARVFSMEPADESVLDSIADAELLSDWARQYGAMMVGNGYWGSGSNGLRPGDYITRGEFAVLMNNIVSVYVDEPGSFFNETGGNIMVRAGGVTIENPNGCSLIITGDGTDGLTTIKNCSDLKYLVGRSGELYPIGTVYSIRLAMPGTVLHASEVQADHGWGAEGTVVDLGTSNNE